MHTPNFEGKNACLSKDDLIDDEEPSLLAESPGRISLDPDGEQ